MSKSRCDCWRHSCEICQGTSGEDQPAVRPQCECHDCTQARAAKPSGMAYKTVLEWSAREVMAERERCAKIAVDTVNAPGFRAEYGNESTASYFKGAVDIACQIANHIRSGK